MIYHRRQATTPGTTCPTLCDKCAGSFTSHRIMNIEGLWDGTSGLSSLSEKTRESNQPFADVITQAALSPQLFKDTECWSGRS